jgi:hypothetical protein
MAEGIKRQTLSTRTGLKAPSGAQGLLQGFYKPEIEHIRLGRDDRAPWPSRRQVWLPVPVSTWVNSPAHDDARCMAPLARSSEQSY